MSNTSLATTLTSLCLGLAASFGGLTLVAAIATAGETTLDKYGTITATRSATDGQTRITVKGKNGWMVNTEYNAKVTLGTTILRRSDGLYTDINKKGDKACEVRWLTTSPEKTGTIKLVFCNDVSCTAPITSDFTVRTK